MVKHNNVVPNGHFKKHWQNYVKTWFDQPARKTRRRIGELIFLLFLSPHSPRVYKQLRLGFIYLFFYVKSICFGSFVYFVCYLVCLTARQKKAMKIFPCPTAGPLRPTVHCQTLKYNMKPRAGRGFTLEELKVENIT